jgi:hypothetical protein
MTDIIDECPFGTDVEFNVVVESTHTVVQYDSDSWTRPPKRRHHVFKTVIAVPSHAVVPVTPATNAVPMPRNTMDSVGSRRYPSKDLPMMKMNVDAYIRTNEESPNGGTKAQLTIVIVITTNAQTWNTLERAKNTS